jgi:DNA-binding MarR family transcriptional regulator
MAGMAINSSQMSRVLLTYQHYSIFDDVSTKRVGWPFMATAQWLDERQARAWQAYLKLNQELYAALEVQLQRDSSLSGADYTVLVPLSTASAGVIRTRELGTEIGWDRSRLSHQISRMERRGLVAREECVEDGRGSMVRLTDAGRSAIEGAAPAHAETVRRYFIDRLSHGELDTLTAVFERLLAGMDRSGV